MTRSGLCIGFGDSNPATSAKMHEENQPGLLGLAEKARRPLVKGRVEAHTVRVPLDTAQCGQFDKLEDGTGAGDEEDRGAAVLGSKRERSGGGGREIDETVEEEVATW